jgi:hypothetical protein
MAANVVPMIKCPVCGSHGRMLHHDIRASLLYSCQKCMHEWQIDPLDDPSQMDSAGSERTGTPSRPKRPKPSKP